MNLPTNEMITYIITIFNHNNGNTANIIATTTLKINIIKKILPYIKILRSRFFLNLLARRLLIDIFFYS